VILSEIWGKKGAIGFVPPKGDGALCTSHFFLFDVHHDKLEPRYLQSIFTANYLQDQLDVEAKGTTGYAAVRPKNLLAAEIPLPPLPEQRRIVARIESLASKIEEARVLREEVQEGLSRLLNAAYHQIADRAPRKTLGELAPLDRRPVTVDFEASYPQVAVRSFGRGTFHKPPLIGSEVTWEKPFLVKAGDILVSNIKAWEGAIAVARTDDDGRVGSHRYLTCVATPGIATARFVCFHLLTSEGLYEVGEASPGSADRNRTLSAKVFMQIPVPMPEYGKQLWFDVLYQKVDSIAKTQSESSPELAALLPSILDQAFKGEL
jgi:type I restriction enzyme S subunit